MKHFVKKHPLIIVFSVLLIGFFLRMYVGTLGFNADSESYEIVAKIVSTKGNVYQETPRYNYGPVWFTILRPLYAISSYISTPSKHFTTYIMTISFFLSFVDALIFAYLYDKVSKKVAYLFFLNPISIIITGYHRQFGNLAILVALYAIEFFKNKSYKKYYTYILLGLSLTVKHLFIFFPFWLFVKEKGIKSRFFAIFIPISIFFLGFFPYLRSEQAIEGIRTNVFQYNSFSNAPLYSMLFEKISLPELFSARSIFFFVMIASSYIFKRTKLFLSFCIYLIMLVIFSPAMANQYLAIPIVGISYLMNPFFALYTIVGTIYLVADYEGLGVELVANHIPNYLLKSQGFNTPYQILVVLLLFGLITFFYTKKKRSLLS